MPNTHILAQIQLGHLWTAEGIYGVAKSLGAAWRARVLTRISPFLDSKAGAES
jgi:hypothetical protein